MAWKLYQVSNGHKSLENFELEADDVFAVLHQLKVYFQERLDAGCGRDLGQWNETNSRMG